MISDRAKQLIPNARIVSFHTWQNLYPSAVLDIFQQADDQRLYLTDENVSQIRAIVPELVAELDRASFLRDHADDVVEQARSQVLQTFPNITEPGGDLYPVVRAEACWRDFWQFLRCVTYGIAGRQAEFTSAEGLANMRLLYDELHVPIAAMVCGLENLKVYGLQALQSAENPELHPDQSTIAAFDHLIAQLKKFQSA